MRKSVFVKKVAGRVYDVFWDNGWLNWSRVLFRTNKGKEVEVLVIKGLNSARGEFLNKEDSDFVINACQQIQIGPTNEVTLSR